MTEKEEPIVDNETGKIKVNKKEEKQPDGNETKGNVTKVKEKMTMKPIVEEETITKVDLKAPIGEKVEDNIEESKETIEPKEVETPEQNAPVLEEVVKKEADKLKEETIEAINESQQTGKPLPENVEKLVDFIEETGGDIHDYVKLNKDYSKMDNHTLLKEYYKESKPHLNNEEIDFLMEDNFSYDEESDDEKEIRRKKLALKEQVANAKTQLEETKSKYYKEIKGGSKLTYEQQKAIDFFNRYNKESEETKKVQESQKATFLKETDNVFNDKFKGFEYNVGEKSYRFNVNNVAEVKNSQVDITNFVKKFLNENNEIKDAEGYHRSMYAAMNPDAIAKHFYEQGKTDAIKNSIDNAKNVDMSPRQSHGETNVGGIKVKVLGDNSDDFKFKIKNKK